MLLLSAAFLSGCLLGIPPTQDCPSPTTLWSFTLNLLFLHPLWGPLAQTLPTFPGLGGPAVLQSHGPSLSTQHPCAQPLLGSRAARPHGLLLVHPGGFTLNSDHSVPSPLSWRFAPLPMLGGVSGGMCKSTSSSERNSCGLLAKPTLDCRKSAGPMAVLALGGPLPI